MWKALLNSDIQKISIIVIVLVIIMPAAYGGG